MGVRKLHIFACGHAFPVPGASPASCLVSLDQVIAVHDLSPAPGACISAAAVCVLQLLDLERAAGGGTQAALCHLSSLLGTGARVMGDTQC